ncbi:MAG: hypothetical protein IJQ73_13810 [Kiritimatiellae bacterium]|nr:hypothetical protein [Kiritimatiellia bacterium]
MGRNILCALAGLLAFSVPLRAEVAPVRFRIRLAGAREAPPTLEDLLFMAARPARREWTLQLPSVGLVTNGQQGVRWYAGGWQRPIYLFEYSGLINVPAGGDYVFQVRRPSFGPAYLLVNGEPIVDFPNRGAFWRRRRGGQAGAGPQMPPGPGEWLAGEPIHLEKGAAEFRAFGFCEARADFGLRWIRPGQSEPTPIPADLFAPAEKLRHGGVDRPLVYRAADARLAGVSAFSFAEDAVRPEIHVRSTADRVEVVATLRFRSETGIAPFAVTSSVPIVKGWGRLEMAEWRAADCESLDWSVRDEAGELATGAARFIHPPFDILPDGVYGDALVRGGTNCLFVARREGSLADPGAPAPAASAILVDGFGGAAAEFLPAALSRAFGGAAPTLERTIFLPDLVRADEAMLAPADLLAVANLVKALPEGLVLLAPEVRGVADGEDPGAFERRLAGVVGLLSEAAGRTVVLVTPPPEMALGGVWTGMRPYAAAIHRVADAYGLRVADVYTLARTAMKNEECKMQNGKGE